MKGMTYIKQIKDFQQVQVEKDNKDNKDKMNSRIINYETYISYSEGLSPRKIRHNKLGWSYHKIVANMLSEIEFGNVLELGTNKVKVVHDSDCMNLIDSFPLKGTGKNIIYDITQTPCPIKDKQYDMFIALQVWEHLGERYSGVHQKAFKEVMRISNRAIISFPYKWNMNKYKIKVENGIEKKVYSSHGGITDEIISEWTCGVKPVKTAVTMGHGRNRTHRKKIYFFDFR